MNFEQFEKEVSCILNARTFHIDADLDDDVDVIRDLFDRGFSVGDAVRFISLSDQSVDEEGERKAIEDRGNLLEKYPMRKGN